MRTSVTDEEQYLATCLIASRYDGFFRTFKQMPAYVRVLEHVSHEQGLGFIAAIEDNANLDLDRIDSFRSNDEQGSSKIERFPEPWGMISPSTLRYVKILSDLIKRFGSLESMSIVEIGVGYGGQAKVILDQFRVGSYTFIDLDEPLSLAERYLKKYDYPGLTFWRPEEVQATGFDLCISNYAFSELLPAVQDEYFYSVLATTSRGYMLCNDIGDAFGLRVRNQAELAALFPDAVVDAEVPLTSPKNYLLRWDRSR